MSFRPEENEAEPLGWRSPQGNAWGFTAGPRCSMGAAGHRDKALAVLEETSSTTASTEPDRHL